MWFQLWNTWLQLMRGSWILTHKIYLFLFFRLTQHGLLASGGGTADKTIRFWNTMTGQPLQCIDTGSQVCNLAWSKGANELVSTHGYSQNQIIIWRYPSLTQVARLTGHTTRVLYLVRNTLTAWIKIPFMHIFQFLFLSCLYLYMHLFCS